MPNGKMNGHKLLKRFEKNFNKYFHEALKVKVHFKRRDIHEMRVTLKKTRAYVELIHDLTGGKSQNHIPVKKINHVFQHAGRLRDEQINLELLRENKVSKDAFRLYEKSVNDIIKKSKQALKTEIKPSSVELKKSQHKALKQLLSSFTASEVEQTARAYLQKKWRDIDKFLSAKDAIKAMHQVRVRLKRIEAVNELMKDNKKFTHPERLDGIMEEIGEWHDLAVFADSLKHVCAKASSKNREPKKELMLLRNSLEKTNKSYARDILISVRQLRRTKPAGQR